MKINKTVAKAQPGELVWFPCDTEDYETRIGLLIQIRDNPADIGKAHYPSQTPRKIVDVLYKEKNYSAWFHSISRVLNESR